jgi:hypothetical protein
MMSKKLILILVVSVFFTSAQAREEDDCQSVMQQLSAAQQLVAIDIDNISLLEVAISSPDWDSEADGWMIDALSSCIDDLITDLNTVSIAEERAHQAHCY